MELTRVGASFLEHKLADDIAAGCVQSDGDFIDSWSLTLIGIGDADVDWVAGSNTAGAEGGLGGGESEFLDIESAFTFAWGEGTGGK